MGHVRHLRNLHTLWLLIAASLAPAQVTAIKAGNLIDPASGRSIPNQIILVEKGRIVKVGSVAIPPDAQVIDLAGYSVMPWLFDCHTHLCLCEYPGRGGSSLLTTLVDSTARRAVQGVSNARAMLMAGFTTCRDVGNEGNYACTEVRWGIENGWHVGPTILNSGRIIAPYGAQFHLQPERADLGEPEYYFADSQDEMRKGVRMNEHFGAKVIKIVVDDQNYIYSADDIKFIVAEAARAGLRVAAHCWTEQGALNAAEAKVASIEHGFEMSQKALDLAKQNGVYLVGTEAPASLFQGLGMPAQAAEAYSKQFIDKLRRAHRNGNKLAFGSDAYVVFPDKDRGQLALTWIESWLEAGVPSAAILKAMTTSAADLLGVAQERGAIAVGQWADIIATPKNPLNDIRVLYGVSFVMKEGKVVRSLQEARTR